MNPIARLCSLRFARVMLIVLLLVQLQPLLIAQDGAQTQGVAVVQQPAAPAVTTEQSAETPVIQSWQDLVIYLIPIIVPLLLALAKSLLYTQVKLADGMMALQAPQWLPTWILPLLAPFVGMLVDYLMSLAGVPGTNTMQAALLGALGVFTRELFKPLTAKVTAPSLGQVPVTVPTDADTAPTTAG